MAKRNLNEVLGFISRWGDSKFSNMIIESKMEDEDNSSVFYTTELPRGARPRKPGDEVKPIFGSIMNKLGRIVGKGKSRIAPKGSTTSKVLGGIGKGIKGAFKGVGTDIGSLLTSEEDYDYIYDVVDIPRKKKSSKKKPALPSSEDKPSELPSSKESDEAEKILPAVKSQDKLPAPKKTEEEENQ